MLVVFILESGSRSSAPAVDFQLLFLLNKFEMLSNAVKTPGTAADRPIVSSAILSSRHSCQPEKRGTPEGMNEIKVTGWNKQNYNVTKGEAMLFKKILKKRRHHVWMKTVVTVHAQSP